MSEPGTLALLSSIEGREALDGGRIGGAVTLTVGTLVADERDSWRRYCRTFPKGVLVLASVLWPGSEGWQHVRIPAAEVLAATEDT